MKPQHIGRCSACNRAVYKLAELQRPCGRKLDHVEPRCAGGPDTFDNLVGSCAACNGDKRERTLLGFLGWRLHRPAFDQLQTWLTDQRRGWFWLGRAEA